MKNGNKSIVKSEKENKSRKGNNQNSGVKALLVAPPWPPSWPSEAQPLPLPSCPAGRGGGGRGKLHHPVLRSAGRGGLPPPLREPRHLRPGRAVHRQGSRQAPEAGPLRAPLLLLAGVQPPSVLSGWHSGRPEGRQSRPGPRTSHLETGGVCVCTKCVSTSVWPPEMQLQEQIRRFSGALLINTPFPFCRCLPRATFVYLPWFLLMKNLEVEEFGNETHGW